MPSTSISVWFNDRELEELRRQFKEVYSDPDSVYTEDEFDEWVGDILLDSWRRKPKL